MKFSDMTYTRPVLETAIRDIGALAEAFEKAGTPEEAENAFLKADKYFEHITTMGSLAYIRHTLDTTDAFYDAEQSYFDEISPILEEPQKRLERALVASPFRAELARRFGGLLFKNIELSLKTFDPIITADLQHENRLTTEYDKLLASARIPFDGKTLTLAQISPYLEEPDAATRRAACDARSAWFLERRDELDRLFGELVSVRTTIAKKLGYDSFVELGYYRMTRNCYDKDMVSRFREGVRKHIVPLAARLKKEQTERIGAAKMTVYDDAFNFLSGNAKPTGTPEQIFSHGKRMYHELSEESGEFIDFMLENDLFDVLTRPGKSGGGYCTELPDYRSPFIFANFNGTSGDIDVLTHEAGHALAAYICRDITPSALREYTHETAEVHSMSMEFFAWPWMEGFFGGGAAKYRYSHMASALTFIPYGTMVDDFQHRIYDEPDMTPQRRNELWLELEGVYRPWLDLSGTPFYEEGRRWQYQAHIFERPFYYIDYCLAQTVALAFWAEDRRGHGAAWDKYRRFIGFAGKRTFTDILSELSLPSPFDPDALARLAGDAARWLDDEQKFN